jgi:hypothetical protein
MPCSLTSWSEKSRTTHRNLGKKAANDVPSCFVFKHSLEKHLGRNALKLRPVLFFYESEKKKPRGGKRTSSLPAVERMYLVISTTSDSVSIALSLIVPTLLISQC